MGVIIIGGLLLCAAVFMLLAIIFGIAMTAVIASVSLIIPQFVTLSCLEMTDSRWPQYVLMLFVNFVLMTGVMIWIHDYPSYSQLGIGFVFGLLLALLIKGENWIRNHT